MTETDGFQQAYMAIAEALSLEAVGSAQYNRLLSLWQDSGSPRPIDLFLIVNAWKTRNVDEEDTGESEAVTILD